MGEEGDETILGTGGNLMFRLSVSVVLPILAALAFCPAAASAGESPFRSDDELGKWVTFYYEHPEPARLDEALLYYASSRRFDAEPMRLPTAQFFAVILRAHPDRVAAFAEAAGKSGSKNAHWEALQVLWLVNTPASLALLRSVPQTWPGFAHGEVVKELLGTPAKDVTASRPESPTDLDMLWLTFFATGDALPLKRISSVLEFPEQIQMDDVLLADAARWSLTSNAKQHPRVLALLKELLPTLSGAEAERLGDILEAASAGSRR
jgi:hypothetical protein